MNRATINGFSDELQQIHKVASTLEKTAISPAMYARAIAGAGADRAEFAAKNKIPGLVPRLPKKTVPTVPAVVRREDVYDKAMAIGEAKKPSRARPVGARSTGITPQEAPMPPKEHVQAIKERLPRERVLNTQGFSTLRAAGYKPRIRTTTEIPTGTLELQV